jgi:hypothetical protein
MWIPAFAGMTEVNRATGELKLNVIPTKVGTHASIQERAVGGVRLWLGLILASVDGDGGDRR